MHSFLLFGGMNNDKDDNITSAKIVVIENKQNDFIYFDNELPDPYLMEEKLPQSKFTYVCERGSDLPEADRFVQS